MYKDPTGHGILDNIGSWLHEKSQGVSQTLQQGGEALNNKGAEVSEKLAQASGPLQKVGKLAHANPETTLKVTLGVSAAIAVAPIAVPALNSLTTAAYVKADVALTQAGARIAGTAAGGVIANAWNKVKDVASNLLGKNGKNNNWPPNDGFKSKSPASLIPGARIDRYGDPTGRFAAPAGTPFSQRSLPADYINKPLNTYEVIKPVDVDAGPTLKWFGQDGDGLQYKLPKTVEELVKSGNLKDLSTKQ